MYIARTLHLSNHTSISGQGMLSRQSARHLDIEVKHIRVPLSSNIPLAHEDWIVVGKLGPPRQQVVAVSRHALLERLERARSPPSAITAPEDFGKGILSRNGASD